MMFWYSAGTPGIQEGMFFFITRMTSGISGAGSSWISPPIIGARVMFMVRPYAWKIGSAASMTSGFGPLPRPFTQAWPCRRFAMRLR